jgi:phage gp36-like protein
MPYATQQDLKDRLAPAILLQLADDDSNSIPDSDLLDAALEDAAAEIDATLAARYATPVSPAPATLLRLNADLAIYYLFLRKTAVISVEHLARAREIRDQLAAFASGQSDLEGAAPILNALDSDSTTEDQEKVFDRETLEPY